MMRRFVLAVLTGMLLTLGACTDSPTGSDPRTSDIPTRAALDDDQLQGCVTEGSCVLPPRSPDWSCDPMIDANACEGDGGDCMTSQPETGDPELVGLAGCGGPSTGGGYTPPPPDTEEPGDCDPQYDLNCNQPLTASDVTTLRNAFPAHLRPATQFTDPAAAEQCRRLKAEYDRLMNTGNVFRGEFDTPDNDPHTDVHVGAYDPISLTMHFEPSALDAANTGDLAATRDIVNTALHEAAHALGFKHTSPVWAGNYDLYAETPFNLLSPGTNSCLTDP